MKYTGPAWLEPQHHDELTAYCRHVNCGAPIFWRKHPQTRKAHPVNPEGGSHFATCPAAGHFRQTEPVDDPNQGGLF